jgi:hypothetical protein
MRKRCTKSKAGRTIVLNENHDLLAEARTQSMTIEFQHEYRTYRPMIERSIAWLVRGQARRLRYIGTERNQIWLWARVEHPPLSRTLRLGGVSWKNKATRAVRADAGDAVIRRSSAETPPRS